MAILNVDSVGTRYPTIGFYTTGSGLSNEGYAPQPYETFAYDIALCMAKIQDFNVVPYTSVIPKDVKFYRDVNNVAPYFFHGAVLEVIMAGVGATYSKGSGKGNVGIRRHGRHYILDSEGPVVAIAATLGTMEHVFDSEGNDVGGYVAEYVGIFEEPIGADKAQEQADAQLQDALKGILDRRGYDYEKNKEHQCLHPIEYAELSADNKYGYALKALGFLGFADAPPPPPPSNK